MKMKKRKRNLYFRMMISLQVALLLKELEEAAEILHNALKEQEAKKGA